MKQIITVRAIIKQDQKLLLLRRSKASQNFSGLYELPGGKVEVGEDPQETMVREIAEETGRTAETMQLYDVRSIIQETQQHIIIVYIATLVPDTQVKLSTEHDKYVWKTKLELQQNDLTYITQTVLKKYNSPTAINKPVNESSNNEVFNTSNRELIVYSDGGSRGNPGSSAAGFVIENMNGDIIYSGGKYLGITTNNQAEYQAVKLALEKAKELGGLTIDFRLDSQLVVNQLNGIFAIKNRDLWPIHSSIKDLLNEFKSVTFTHVRREFNQQADAMVNKILDEHKQ